MCTTYQQPTRVAFVPDKCMLKPASDLFSVRVVLGRLVVENSSLIVKFVSFPVSVYSVPAMRRWRSGCHFVPRPEDRSAGSGKCCTTMQLLVNISYARIITCPTICFLQSPKKIGDDIAKATGDWKGLKITVCLTIQNRQAAISVVPSAASLIVKALKEPPRDRKKVKNSTYHVEEKSENLPSQRPP